VRRPFLLPALFFLLSAMPALAADAPPEPQPEHDPWQGMDHDGRIPAVEKPVNHPERWRYIPEGRIKPGNVFQRFLVSSFIAPFIFNDSDVGFGAGLALTDIDFREQRRREFLGAFVSYTTEGQQAYTLLWQRWLHHIDLPQGGVLQEERSRVRAGVSYSRSLTRRFFGFGDDTDDGLRGRVHVRGRRPDIALPGGDDRARRVRGGSQPRARARGRRVTGDVFPEQFDDGDRDGSAGPSSWLGHARQRGLPYKGFDVGAHRRGAVCVRPTRSIFGVFSVIPCRASSTQEAGTSEGTIQSAIALHLETETTAGDLPFYSLPSLGGAERGRGFIEGRFRDRSLWAATAEYRFWVIPRGFALSPWTPTVRVERLGLALFYDVGSVADEWWDLFSADPKNSGGIGFRCTLERNAPFRVDVGFSDEGPQVTAGFGLSF
jgi:hypothetical protein